MPSPDRFGFKNRTFVLPDNEGIPNCDDSAVWTNLTEEEIYVCFGGPKTIPHSGYHRCNLAKSADQSVAGLVWTHITFDQETSDVGDLHDNTTNNTRITIKKAGEYRIFYQVKCNAQDKTAYESRVYKNGDTTIEGTCNVRNGSKDASFLCLNLVSPIITLAVDDYIELQFYHDNASSQNVLASNTFLGIQRIY